jgi:WD40 repeat protein
MNLKYFISLFIFTFAFSQIVDKDFYIDTRSSATDAIFCLDNKSILSSYKDGKIRLWNIRKNSLIKIFKGHTDRVNSLVFSDYLNKIISISDDKTVRIWDINSTKEINKLTMEDKLLSIDISPNQKSIVVGLADGNIFLIDINSTKIVKKIKAHNKSINGIALSTHYIISASDDKTIKIWNRESGKLINTLVGHKDKVLSVTIDKNEKYIISGSQDFTTRVWSIKGKIIKIFKGHYSSVNSVALTPTYIMSVSGSFWGKRDNSIKIWSRKRKKLITTIKAHSDYINSIRVSNNNRYIVTASNDQTVKIWDLKKKKLLETLQGDKSLINSIDISKDENYLLTSSHDNKARLWNLENEQLIKEFNVKNIHFASFSGNSRYIVFGSGGLNGSTHGIEIWDRKKNKFIKSYKTKRYIISLDVSTGRYIVATLQDSYNIKLWDRKRNGYKKTLKGHMGQVNSVAIDKNGDFIVSGSDDNTIKIWNRRGKEIKTLRGHNNRVTSVKISNDTKYIISASDDKSIKLWNRKKGTLIKTFENDKYAIKHISISKNQKYIACSSISIDEQDNIIKVIDIATGKTIWKNINETKPISSIIILKNRYLLTGSIDGIKMWDFLNNTKKPIKEFIGGATKRWFIKSEI